MACEDFRVVMGRARLPYGVDHNAKRKVILILLEIFFTHQRQRTILVGHLPFVTLDGSNFSLISHL